MPTIKAVPDRVDVRGYGGDTLPIRVNTSGLTWTNPQWSAQVRSSRTATEVAATFVITPDATGAWLVLSAQATAELMADALADWAAADPETRVPVPMFEGQWDVQVKDGDIVTTLAQGALTIEADVTRSA